jgi:hypothetical protein
MKLLLSPLLINLERGCVGLLAAVALLLAIVSFRGLVPVQDPLTPVGYIDSISLLFGLHEQSHVIVVAGHQWTTDVHVFTFQRRLKDGAFYLNGEHKTSLGFGFLDQISRDSTETRCRAVLAACHAGLPFTASRHQTPVMVGLPGLATLGDQERRTLIEGLDSCLEASVYGYSKEGGLGVVTPGLQTAMQWFAVSLLSGRLPFQKPGETPVLVETTEEDLLLTFAVADTARLGNGTIASQQKVEVFGELWDLVTVRVPGLGVLRARQMVLTDRQPEKLLAASPCVNPVVDRWWDFGGVRYHVKGLHRSVEEVKERNGPFAGKRVARPVANYEACHTVVLAHLQATIGTTFQQVINDLKRRKVFIRGKLFIKCAERGLTDPFKGGNVKLKTFMDSLKHACKVPNTDQPYACVDMMVAGVVLDKVLGLHQGSALLTPHQISGITGDWPVTAALQQYQSAGL